MSVLDEIDNLYEQSVTSPESVNDQMLADWAEGVASGYELDREAAKYVRRSMRNARKLAAFWAERVSLSDGTDDHPDGWSSRVDLTLGVKAWRPQLDLARHLLDVTPSNEIYERASVLFRLVNNEEFLDGMSYDEWNQQA